MHITGNGFAEAMAAIKCLLCLKWAVDKEVKYWILSQLGYGVVERIIAEHFDMGCPSSSNFPIGFSEETYGTYSLNGTKCIGNFSIRIAKKTNGKYELMVSLIGNLKRK